MTEWEKKKWDCWFCLGAALRECSIRTSRYLLFSRILILFVSPCGCWPTENDSCVYTCAHMITRANSKSCYINDNFWAKRSKQQKPICRSICFYFIFWCCQNFEIRTLKVSDTHTMTKCMYICTVLISYVISLCGKHVALSCFVQLNIICA